MDNALPKATNAPTGADIQGVTAFGRFVNKIGNGAAILAGCAIILILVLVCIEVALRPFKISLQIVDEICGYLNAAAVFLGLAYTLREGGFIRVELIYDRLKGSLKTGVRWLIVLTGLFYVAVLLYFTILHVYYLYLKNVKAVSVIETPEWIPQIGRHRWPRGLVVAARGLCRQSRPQRSLTAADPSPHHCQTRIHRPEEEHFMSLDFIIPVLLIALTVMLVAGQWMAFALGAVGMLIMYHEQGRARVCNRCRRWSGIPSNSYILIAVPMFLLMGEMILRSGASNYFYRGVVVLLGRLPGGLLHANIF